MTLRYFKLEEFACKCGCKANNINMEFAEKIDDIRHMYGKAIIISSGYRCPLHNMRVSKTGSFGPHTTGHAADLQVDRGNAFVILEIAFETEMFTGVGIQQKGEGRFIHLDDLPHAQGQPRPTVWSY